ncbi:MAG TPA: cyclic nucleotide-binding domain-containing protein, partial [Chitinophagaceae bacterium]|nr:cyclic nucleotide-binding domain-containing protein [Chitinophagaceae bacterium]
MYEPLLQNIRSIVALTEEEGALLCTHVERRRVKKRQWLVTPGEPCRAEHYILKGCFRAYCVGDDGQEHITKLSVEDWWITDVQRFLTGEPAQLYVEALE